MTIYLDNAATSFPKPEAAYAAADQALRGATSPGRGGHRLALAANRLLFECRETLAGFFGIGDSARVTFTSGATAAINEAISGLLRSGDRVVTSSMEHNAVMRSLRAAAERGVAIVKVAADGRGFVDPEAIRLACREKATRLVVLSHCSNVTGTVQPIAELGQWCRREGILLLVDAAQSAGHLAVHAEAMGIDLLAVPGHKGMMGPPGTGLLYVREGVELVPLMYGGTGGNSHSDLPPEELPERLEAGTLNLPGLAGLKAAADFLQQEGLAAVHMRLAGLMERLIEGLRQIRSVQLYGHLEAGHHGCALSFNIAGRDPAEIGFLLDRDFGICCRSGLHCAPDAHRTIGTFPQGTVRLSPGYFTTPDDIERLLTAVAAIAAGSHQV